MYISISSVVYVILQLFWQFSDDSNISGFTLAGELFMLYIFLTMGCGLSVVKHEDKIHIIEEAIVFLILFLGIILAAYFIRGQDSPTDVFRLTPIMQFSVAFAPLLAKLLSRVRYKFR